MRQGNMLVVQIPEDPYRPELREQLSTARCRDYFLLGNSRANLPRASLELTTLPNDRIISVAPASLAQRYLSGDERADIFDKMGGIAIAFPTTSRRGVLVGGIRT